MTGAEGGTDEIGPALGKGEPDGLGWSDEFTAGATEARGDAQAAVIKTTLRNAAAHRELREPPPPQRCMPGWYDAQTTFQKWRSVLRTR